MNLLQTTRPLTRAAALAAALLAAPLSAGGAQLFDGGGYGPTAQTAIQAAIWDAEATASAYGLFACVLVGEPMIFQNPPGSRRAFNAQVQMRCT